jgi:site-specific DNA-methyltransferase (adenine-specific)
MNNDLLFSSEASDWETPKELFDQLDTEFYFDIDVCASTKNTKCLGFYDEKANGLEQDWGCSVCWMNPPYGKTIGQWMDKALAATRRGATVVCLIPARTSTSWWHRVVMQATEIRFIVGRVRFVGAVWDAPFPSVIVVFRHGQLGCPQISSYTYEKATSKTERS